jgi:hypothetical protein
MSYGLMMGGAPVSITQQQLGHTNLATTQRYLDHIAPKELVGIKQLLRSPPPQRPNAPLFEHSSLAVEPCTFTRQYWFGLGVLEALECGMLVRSGEDPSTTSSSANWERTDNDMDRLEAASAAKSRPECVPEDAHYVPVTHCNPWYIRAIPAPPGTT